MPMGTRFQSAAVMGPANSRNYAFGYTHLITPNLVNDFHFGVNQFLTDSLNYWYVNGLKTPERTLVSQGSTTTLPTICPAFPTSM